MSTWQNPQARVQRSPLIMKVAVPVGPALEDVRAAGLLAHRHQAQAPHRVLSGTGTEALGPQPLRLAAP